MGQVIHTGQVTHMAELTPVTVLTGFLGAGKTTLLNHLVRQPALARTAVLVNEFGEIGIDHLLVQKVDADTVLLNAGCLCCTVRGDLVRALRSLLPRARRDDITRIVIETTGLADPAPILATLLNDPVASSAYRLDGVVTVLDAVHGDRQLDEHPEALRQLVAADRVVLSKTDLADPAPLLRRIAQLNPGVQVIEAKFGAVDADKLLGAGVFDPASKHPDLAAWLDQAAFEAAAHDHHHHDRNRHDAHIQAFSVVLEDPVPWQAISVWLEMLVAAHGDRLMRLKGILNLRGQDKPVAVHGVQHLIHPPTVLPEWPQDDPRTSRLVFITRDLPRVVIEEGLRAFVMAAR
jgi:G3E family GTPase